MLKNIIDNNPLGDEAIISFIRGLEESQKLLIELNLGKKTF